MAAAVFALGDVTFEGGVFQRVVFGVHRQVVDGRGVRKVFRHSPTDQHTIAFQPEVVVQPAGVMLLNDEAIVLPRRRLGRRHRFRGPARVPHTAVGGEPIGHRRVDIHAREQIAVASQAGQHLVEPQLAQLRIVEFLPGARRGDGRFVAAA